MAVQVPFDKPVNNAICNLFQFIKTYQEKFSVVKQALTPRVYYDSEEWQGSLHDQCNQDQLKRSTESEIEGFLYPEAIVSEVTLDRN